MSKNNGSAPSIMLPTSSKKWRQARLEGYTLQLPSGNMATLKPVALDQLMLTGEIPDLLSPAAARSLWLDTPSDQIAQDPEMNKDFLALINLIVPLAMLVPAVVADPDPEKEEISLEDLDFMDKVAIFNLATQPAEQLRIFREQQEERLSALRDRKNNEQQTEPTTELKG